MATQPLTISVKQTVGADLRRFKGKAMSDVAGVMREEGEDTMTDAKELTPVETGTLRASGHVEGPEIGGNVVTVTMAFGGAASDYAAIVHERLDVHHPVGQAKYLEQPALQHAEQLPKRIVRVLGG